MQTLQNPAVIVVLTLAAAVIGYHLWGYVQAERAKAKAEKQKQEDARNAVFTDFAAQIGALATSYSRVGDLVEKGLEAVKVAQVAMAGTQKACEAIAATTDKHRLTILDFQKLCFGTDPGKEALQFPSDAERDKRYTAMQHIAEGKTVEEADALAEVEEARAASSYPTE